jgi:hypothetical protein
MYYCIPFFMLLRPDYSLCLSAWFSCCWASICAARLDLPAPGRPQRHMRHTGAWPSPCILPTQPACDTLRIYRQWMRP